MSLKYHNVQGIKQILLHDAKYKLHREEKETIII